MKFAKQSLGFFTNKNQVRIFMVWLTTWKWFDRIILLLIILNSICLGVKDYTDVLKSKILTLDTLYLKSDKIFFSLNT